MAVKRILLMALGELSSGELIIAYEFAKNVRDKKYGLDFLIPQMRKPLIESYNRGQIYCVSPKDTWKDNKEKILHWIEENSYDLLILFDVFTFEYAQKWTGMDLNVLLNLEIPLASLDEYNYLQGDFKLDYYGVIVKKLPNLLDKMDYIIRNCPLSMPLSLEEKEGIYFYKVLEKSTLKEDKVNKIRHDHLMAQEKLVFFTLSDWELNGAYSFINHKFLMESLLPIVYEYLKETGVKIHLLHVGANIWDFPQGQKDTIRYSHFPSLEVEDFEAYLFSADLYITYNLVSISLTKAIEFQVPSVVLNNDKVLDFQRLEKKLKSKPPWYQEVAKKIRIVYPFSASSFGWNHFLKAISKGNPYMETFYRLQTFHRDSVKERLKNLLEQGLESDKLQAIFDYKEKKAKIDGPEEVLDKIFAQGGEESNDTKIF